MAKHFRNVDPTGDDRTIDDLNVTIANGDTIEVSDEVAEALLRQPTIWQVVNDETKSRGK